MFKKPLASVATAVRVLFIVTVAPKIGSPFSSVTPPLQHPVLFPD